MAFIVIYNSPQRSYTVSIMAIVIYSVRWPSQEPIYWRHLESPPFRVLKFPLNCGGTILIRKLWFIRGTPYIYIHTYIYIYYPYLVNLVTGYHYFSSQPGFITPALTFWRGKGRDRDIDELFARMGSKNAIAVIWSKSPTLGHMIAY